MSGITPAKNNFKKKFANPRMKRYKCSYSGVSCVSSSSLPNSPSKKPAKKENSAGFFFDFYADVVLCATSAFLWTKPRS